MFACGPKCFTRRRDETIKLAAMEKCVFHPQTVASVNRRLGLGLGLGLELASVNRRQSIFSGNSVRVRVRVSVC